MFTDGNHPLQEFSDYLNYFQEASKHITQTVDKNGYHPVVVGKYRIILEIGNQQFSLHTA